MNLVGVKNSSGVEKVGYDPVTQRAVVVYKGGREYPYVGVTPEHGQQLLDSAASEEISTGTLVNSIIKPNYAVGDREGER